LFHFRGAVRNDSYSKKYIHYEFSSGLSSKFEVSFNTDEDFERGNSIHFIIGFLFFTVYLTLPFFKVPRLISGREYGFYWHEWECRFFWHTKPWEGSNKDWVWHFKPIEIMFGKQIFFEKEIDKTYSPKYFMFRGQEYKMDEIKLLKRFWFRSRVPYSWWHRELSAYDLKIENPPMRAGKGTTDYNCGDDATYGSSGPYNGPSYKTWQDREKAYEFLVEEYCKGVMKN